MYECGTCGKVFPAGWRARDNHCRATGHCAPDYECDTCDRWFSSDDAKWQHMERKNHFAWDCDDCDETWPTEKRLKEHQVDDHFYCDDCDRYFNSLNNIKMHLNSRVHLGKNIQCPFCKVSYTTATGMVHHLEGGSCPSAPSLDRDTIYRIVRSKDPSGVISKKLIGWKGDSESKYEATNKAWNGAAWECYFCPKTFSRRAGLNMHLNSPAHYQALYHCPNRFCRKDFRTLAAILNHLESETCGAMRFDAVQRQVGDMITGNRMLTF